MEKERVCTGAFAQSISSYVRVVMILTMARAVFCLYLTNSAEGKYEEAL